MSSVRAGERWEDAGKPIVETWNAALPRFSNDGNDLAYAAFIREDGVGRMEVKRVRLPELHSLTLLPRAAAAGNAAGYGAFPVALAWTGPHTLMATVSNGDDVSTVYRLDSEHAGALDANERMIGDEDPPPSIDPAVQALAADWPSEALANAMQYVVRIRGKGLLAQKHYAGQDDDVWWFDLANRRLSVALAKDDGRKLELLDGFAFAGRALFALRRGTTVSAWVLEGEGTLREVEQTRFDAQVGADAVHSTSGGIDARRCSKEACWARYWTRTSDDRWQVRILRFDATGKVEVLEAIEGLRDFDVNAGFDTLAANARQGDSWRIELHRVTAF